MKPKRIRYNTMNSWNLMTAPAYNLKVHKVIPFHLQDKVFEMMECDNFYDNIHSFMDVFAVQHDFKWQAQFNGRSGGYLVLYRGEKKPSEYKSVCKVCGQQNFKTVEEDSNKCGRCGANERVNSVMHKVVISVGQIDDADVPKAIMKSFEKLANDIVNSVIRQAKSCKVDEETYTITETRKVMAAA